jgi:uncharacterized protein (DUF488 family)
MENLKRLHPKIFTIGHGNRTWEEFIFLLKKYEIEIIADVRSLPYSRFFPQFRKNNLKENLEKNNIAYLWMGESLGGRPKDQQFYTAGKISYDKIKNADSFQHGISELKELIIHGSNVAMMCSESDPNNCHRKHLLTPEFIKDDVDVIHIDKIGMLENEQQQPPSLF